MVTGSDDVNEIYHRMALIRRDLHTNVSESVAGAEAVVDWGRCTWTYPWIALGAADAVGYLICTSGRQTVAAGTASLADMPWPIRRGMQGPNRSPNPGRSRWLPSNPKNPRIKIIFGI